MPVHRVELSPAIKVLDLKDGKKQFYKTGPYKDKPKYKIKKSAKHGKELSVDIIRYYMNGVDTIVIEKQQGMIGNAAASSFTIGVNYGKLLALAEISCHDIVIVSPATWKKDMHITVNKSEKLALGNDKALIKETLKAKAVSLARSLTTMDFLSPRGRLLHDEAEAALIGFWYIGDNHENKSI